jgi:hypothetical protein
MNSILNVYNLQCCDSFSGCNQAVGKWKLHLHNLWSPRIQFDIDGADLRRCIRVKSQMFIIIPCLVHKKALLQITLRPHWHETCDQNELKFVYALGTSPD